MITDRDVAQVAALLPPHSYVRQFLDYTLSVSEIPLAYSLGVALSHLATIAHRDLGFRLTTIERANLFTLCVGPSGSRKTQSIKLGNPILDPIVGGRTGETPGSWEGLEEGFASHPVTLHQYPEFGDFLKKSGSQRGHSSYYSAIRQAYTKLFDCDDYRRRKAGNSIVTVRDPRLSILGAVTPEYIERHTDHEDWCGGFMGRFLVFLSDRERTDDRSLAWPEKEDWLRRRLGQMYSGLHRETDPCTFDYRGRTPEAQARYAAWYQEVEAARRTANQWAASALSRLAVNVMKVATLLSLDFGIVGDGSKPCTSPLTPFTWQIGIDALAPAIAIVDLHYRSVLSVIDRLASSPYEIERRNVLATLSHDTPQPIFHILRNLQPRMHLGQLQRTLETLIASREITRLDGALGSEPLYVLRAPDVLQSERPESPPENIVPLHPQVVEKPADEPDEPAFDWGSFLG